jgi:hypothetical protein
VPFPYLVNRCVWRSYLLWIDVIAVSAKDGGWVGGEGGEGGQISKLQFF